MGRNFKTLILISSLTVIYSIYYWGVPAIINISGRTDYIENKIYQETGYRIKLENPKLKMGYTPSIWINADNFALLNSDNSKAINIDKLNLNIKLLPLILKKVNVSHFSSENIKINLNYSKNSELKIGQYKIPTNIKPEFKLEHASAQIGNYSILLNDELQNKKIYFNGDYLDINNFDYDKQIKISTNAQIITGKKKALVKTNINLTLPINKIEEDQLEISGHIINLDLSDFSEYAKTVSKNKIKSTTGIINFIAETNNNGSHKNIKSNFTAKNLKILTQDKASSIICNDKIEIISNINTIKNGIKINDLKFLSDGIHIFTTGEINRLNDKIPKVNLKISINKSKIENIISLLPGISDLTPDIDLYLLKKAGFWGNVMGNLELKGKADYPDVYGNMLVSDAYMVKPIPKADKAVIKLSYTGNKMNLDVKVPTSSSENVYVKGYIDLNKERSADLNITSTDNVDLKTAQIVLNPLHDILHFDLGPVPIMDIKGKGGINLHVIGTRQNPHGWGQFHFKNATVSFLDIHNMVLNNGSGTLDFNNQNTFFQTKTALLNGQPISVKGTCSLIGELNFDVIAKNQNLEKLLKTVKTSPMLADIQKLISPIENGYGNANIKINLTGKVKDPKDIVFNKNLFAKGQIELLSNKIKLKGVPATISGISGILNFNNTDADFKLTSHLDKSQININGKIKDNNCDTTIVSNKFNIGDGIELLPSEFKIPYKKDLATINTSFVGKYKGSLENINFDNVYLKGKIYSNKGAKSAIIVNNSSFELNNSNFKLPLLKGSFKNSPYNISLNISKMFDKHRVVNGNCKITSLDLNLINDQALQFILPPDLATQFKDIDFLNGNINLSAKVRNNNLNAFTKLDDISLLYKPKHLKLTINSGNLLLRNNLLNLNKINAQLGEMPVFINGSVANIEKNPNLNLYINAKPTQEFFDQFFNNKSVYPIKLKGDVIFTSNLNGTIENLNAKSILKIADNSSIYYMGASIGDVENPVKITIDNTYSPNKIRINHLQYDKIITSQNNKPYVNTQLNAQGTVNLINDSIIGFNNFKIKTQTPTDAKIFNIIFRKPFMKQGVFTSDLILNGTSINPKIKGKLNITSIDIPFFDSTIKDISLDFKNDKLYITSKGTVLTNDVLLNAEMKNQLIPPYTVNNLKIKLADLNINKITDTLRDIEAEAIRNQNISSSTNIQPFDISQLIIHKAFIEADKIQVRNINAKNFTTNLSLNKDGLADVKDFKFNIAEGIVTGNFKHNLNTHKTILDINLEKANALIMSEALFDLKGQVYGSVNGNFTLICTGDSQEDCFRTLSGGGTFKIADGKMPKLGSLEYLLKAGNLLKGGFTGLSINSLVDLITPLKTGDFDSIYGDIHLKDGMANNINIYSDGHDLNMYMTGSYNLLTSIADMKIYGSLTKDITTVFGKIKNASLNTLFNTIPGINDATEKLLLQEDIGKIPNIKDATNIYRIFAVDINGDINGTNYVKSFRWVK